MEFLTIILTYPTVIYTTLLGVVLVYWLLAMVGLVDFESGGPDLGLEVGVEVSGDMGGDAGADVGSDASPDHHLLDGEAANASTLAGYLIAIGLGGVPFSVVVSLLTLFAWAISSIAALWLVQYVPTSILRFLVGTGVLVGAFLLALPLAAATVRPLRKLFVSHNAISNFSLVGMRCKVLTGTVDEKFGRAEVPSRGAGYHIRVVAETPNTLTRDSVAFIVEYDEATMVYRIQEEG
ncbi:hypothetical protein AGMMS49545_22320 [Betaproteobacteria bacterium]|nr:hypothetical protein AGMMS49545_22320 [Betaproteobacteria bacterium]GHU39913.1 hypothetical protein AGMMS50289_00550 [Betaproteobacteria bacterium]